MLIDLKKYFSGEDISQAIDYTVDLSEVEIDGCKPFVTPVQVKGSIRSFASSGPRTSGRPRASPRMRYAYSMPCNRCLTLTRKELCHNISHVIVNKLNDEEDFEDYIVIEGDELDLDELIYSDIILLTPTKFLCKEDCKGLCPTCGKNLNEGDCACAKQQTDPRLEALRQLLQ